MKNIKLDENIQMSDELFNKLIKKLKFIVKHRKSKYLIYTENFGEDLFIQFPRKWLAEYFLFKTFELKEFHYISSNGSEYDKELHLFPDEEYDFKQFKYAKKKEK